LDGEYLINGVDVRALFEKYQLDRCCSILQNIMLRDSVVDKEIYEARAKGKRTIKNILTNGNGYDGLDAPLGDVDSGDTRAGTAWDSDPSERRDLGPPQAETIPLETGNPFPMLDGPVEM